MEHRKPYLFTPENIRKGEELFKYYSGEKSLNIFHSEFKKFIKHPPINKKDARLLMIYILSTNYKMPTTDEEESYLIENIVGLYLLNPMKYHNLYKIFEILFYDYWDHIVLDIAHYVLVSVYMKDNDKKGFIWYSQYYDYSFCQLVQNIITYEELFEKDRDPIMSNFLYLCVMGTNDESLDIIKNSHHLHKTQSLEGFNRKLSMIQRMNYKVKRIAR